MGLRLRQAFLIIGLVLTVALLAYASARCDGPQPKWKPRPEPTEPGHMGAPVP